ncbi:MAG: ROK family protein [Chloroflexi bacterium]|nr:ROK family protein [Chloroflexota bacterium]
MNNPFQPKLPFITPSINRVRMVSLPGLTLPDEIIGKLGYELLSARRLATQIRRRATELNLHPDRPDLIRAFDDCLSVPSFPIRSAAEEIAAGYGRSLAYLLLILKRGDSASRAARPDWERRHWDWWGTINTVWLGGGLVSGHLGQIAAATAQTMIREAGFPRFTIHISPYGGNLSLVGAARLVPNKTNAALVFDFGHTQVKRGVAQLENGRLTDLIPFSPLPAPCEPYQYHGWPSEKSGQVMQGMTTAVAQTWDEAKKLGHSPGSTLVVSLACYLIDGHPIPSHLETGCYSRLQTLADNLEQFTTAQISAALAQPVQVKLVHDATAAALAYTGWRETANDDQNTAVITLGTSLGIGFPP